MKQTAAIALLVARANAQRADMAQDRAAEQVVFKAAEYYTGGECTDAGVTAAKAAAAGADTAFADEQKKVDVTAAAITAKLVIQATKVTALNTERDATANKGLRDSDLTKDQAELDAQVALNAAKDAHQVAKDEAARLLKVKDAAKVADDAQGVIVAAATTAETAATNHETDETTLVTSTLGTMNSAMTTWKGAQAAAVVAGAVNAGAAAGSEAGKMGATKTKLTALQKAVGTCTTLGVAAVLELGGTCGGTTTGLVKWALRKKSAVDAITTSTAKRETYLDAFCKAAQTLGAPDADIKNGKEYYARANPGVRTDFLFTAAMSTSANQISDTYYWGASGWTFEDLGDRVTAEKSVPAMADNSANQKKWGLLKCLAAAAGTNTGNAARVYGVASGIASASGSVTATMETKITTAQTTKLASGAAPNASASLLEDKFKIWKDKAKTTMTAYKTMIDGDTSYTEVQDSGSSKGCKSTGGTDDCTLTVYTSCQEAEVPKVESPGTLAAKRPANLVATISSPADNAALFAACKTECQKLPSFGLKTDSETPTGQAPQIATEVCQGIEIKAAGFDAVAIATCKFVSKARRAGTGSDFVTLAANGANTLKCYKRDNQKGILWRLEVAKTMNHAFGAGYNPTAVVSAYSDYTGLIDAWVTKRKDVYAAYADYLALKWVVTKSGDLYLGQVTTVLRNTARVSGTTGTDITNQNLNDAYAAEWAKVYGTNSMIQAVPAHTTALTTTYSDLAPVNKTATGSTTYALWMIAKGEEATAKKAYDDAKAAWELQKTAKADQTTIKGEATKEKNAAVTARGAAASGATAGTGTAEALNVATKAYDAYIKATVGALGTLETKKKAEVDAQKTFDDAKKASDDHAKLATVIAAYKALDDARALARTAVGETQKAIDADAAARLLLEAKRKTKVEKQGLLDKARTTCRNAKYDAYKTTYSQAIAARETKLGTIKDLLEKKDKAAPKAGATGARCEKALSQGNGRAARAKPCTAETDCCGAAKGPVLKLADWPTAPIMTIETCQPKANKTYTYSPPRAPMQTTDPAAAANSASQQTWPFACIAGASKLAAAATALATTAYMMA